MSYNPDQRISRKDAAVLARRSEDTLRRAERDTNAPLDRQTETETGQATYRVGDLVERGFIRIGRGGRRHRLRGR